MRDRRGWVDSIGVRVVGEMWVEGVRCIVSQWELAQTEL